MLLIDAYNVLLAPGVLPMHLAGLEVDGLVRLIGVSRYARTRVILACDGAGPRRGHHPGGGGRMADAAGRAGDDRPGIEVVYAGPGGEADTLIEEMLERDSAARRWTVVSGDRRVQRAAASAGAQVLASTTFLKQLVLDERRPAFTPHPRQIHKIPLDRLDVALWMRELGVDGAEFRDLPSAAEEPPPAGPAVSKSSPTRPPAPSRRASEAARPAPTPATPQAKPPKGKKASAPRGAAPVPGPPPSPLDPPLTFPAAMVPPELDPVLQELLDGLEDGIRLEDLDMRRWLGDSGGPPRPT